MKKFSTFLIMLMISFFILIKGTVSLYQHNYHYLLCLFLTCSAVVILNFITFKIFFKKVKFRWMTFLTYGLLATYLIFCLVPRKDNNFKTSEIKKEYTSLHPILRLGVGTLFLIDRKSIMTDGSRSKEDCEKMKINYTSDHAIKDDGYCYAIDISVRNRSWYRNILVECYFRLMGYYTLRHNQGFGDHFHIALKK